MEKLVNLIKTLISALAYIILTAGMIAAVFFGFNLHLLPVEIYVIAIAVIIVVFIAWILSKLEGD